jgi:hypothetical protein
MVKTLTDRFKIGKSKEKKLDLVSALNQSEERYRNNFDEVYSGIQTEREKYENLFNRYSEGKILKQEKKKLSSIKEVKKGVATLVAVAGLGFSGCQNLMDPQAEEPEIPIESALPSVDFSGLDKTLVDGRTRTITLPAPYDEDSRNVPYNCVRSLDDNVSATLNGRELTLTAIPVSEETNYQLEFDFGTEQGGKNTATLEGKIENLCDISGELQDNETDSNQAGEIRLYNKDKIKLAETNTSNGVFNVQASEPASEIYLQAKVGDNGYIRTIKLDGSKDYSEKIVRAVTEPDFPTTGGNPKADFKEFLRRTNFGFRKGDLYGGLKRWNFGEEENGTIFQGLEILDKDPNTGAQFTPEQQDLIKQYIKDKESGYLKGGEINIQKDDEDTSDINKHYVKNSDGTTSALKGWGIIIPASLDSDIAGLTDTYDLDGDNYIDKYKIRLDINCIDSRIIIHEFLHGMIYFGHSHEERDNKIIESLMAYNGGNAKSMTEADVKGNYIIEELTYPVKSNIEEILGMNWMN